VSKWEKVKLGDVCEKKISVIDSKRKCLIDYIDISSINNETKEIESYTVYESIEAPSRAKQLIQAGDILVSTVRPNLNAVGLVKQSHENILVASTGFCVLRANEQIARNYLFHYCKSKSFISSLMLVARGASYPAVSSSDVKNLEIPLPPLEVQKQIAKNLDTVSELLALRKKQLEELDGLIKSVFYDMFGDPAANDKGWETRELGYITEKITDGKHGDCENDEMSGYFFVSAKDIKDGRIEYKNVRQITKEDFEQTNKRTLLAPGDIVVVNTGATIGKATIAENNDFTYRTTFQKSVGIIKVNEKYLVNRYLFYYIHIDRERIYNSASGSAQKNWLLSQMRQYSIMLPPIQLQNKFLLIVTKIEEQKSLVKQSIEETQQIFDSLMSQYFD